MTTYLRGLRGFLDIISDIILDDFLMSKLVTIVRRKGPVCPYVGITVNIKKICQNLQNVKLAASQPIGARHSKRKVAQAGTVKLSQHIRYKIQKDITANS